MDNFCGITGTEMSLFEGILVTSTTSKSEKSAPITPQKTLLAQQSAEAHCSYRVGTTSEYPAKLPHLLEEPSHLPAELQNLVPKPDLAFLNFWSKMSAEMLFFHIIPVISII